MQKYTQIISEPLNSNKSNTNESVGVLLAAACVAYACKPIIDAIGERIKKGAEKKAAEGFSFWEWIFGKKSKDNNDSNSEGHDNKEKNNEAKNNEAFNSLIMIARQKNEKEKDKNEKAKNKCLIKLLTACSFDENGNELPLEERINKMKDHMSEEQFEAFKKDMVETYEKNKNNQDFKDELMKAKANIKREDYNKMLEDAKKEAKSTLEQLDKEKKELDEYNEKLQDLEDQVSGGDEKDKEIRRLKRQLDELKQNPPKSIVFTATGTDSAGATKDPEKNDTTQKDPKKEDTTQTGEQGEKISDEEVEDPKTGKKIKVKLHTGPRGGRYYYPEGSPKTPEHKVYVESISLVDYLLESFED